MVANCRKQNERDLIRCLIAVIGKRNRSRSNEHLQMLGLAGSKFDSNLRCFSCQLATSSKSKRLCGASLHLEVLM